MGKHEFGTPKHIAKMMKAKGLQKLRWYCQMCEKQCRDENGFKCHMMSESHQRQLLLFADNPHRYIDDFSYEFQKGYLELLKRRFGTRRVHCNQVYQEYIADRHHLHMNSTKWETLTGFVKWLGKEGKCVVDETEKGWYVQYIDRDPETIAKQQAKAKKEKMEKDDAERLLDFIEKQVEKGKVQLENETPVYTELKRESEEEKITLNLQASTSKFKEPAPPRPISHNALVKKGEIEERKEKKGKEVIGEKKRKFTVLDEIKEEEERRKEKVNRMDHWITEGIVVKVITKSLGDKYYKQKGYIREVIDKFLAVVVMLDTGHKLKLDQAHLETVIPAVGRPVQVLNGAYRGCHALLKALNEKSFTVIVQIDSGVLTGRTVEGIAYEDVSKIYIAPS